MQLKSTYPKLAILGNGRSGKDTGGMWLHLHTPLKYVGSTSMVCCPIIAVDLKKSPAEAWASRHENRIFWWQWANNYRLDDPTKLAKLVLQTGDLVVGLRDTIEFDSCVKAGLFDLSIWIHRDVPDDPTVTFRRSDCDVVIDNTGESYDYFRRLARFSTLLKLPVTNCTECNDPLSCKAALRELKHWDEVQNFLSKNKS